MHITQLQYFMHVANTGSISKTAESLFVSQSAVSKQILMLEKELGFPLFDRGYRKITLTDQGMVLSTCLRRCSMDFENTLNAIRSTSRHHLLRVGYVEYWDPCKVQEPVFQALGDSAEDVEISLEPYRVSELADALLRGNVDMVVSYDAAFSGRDGLEIVPLGKLLCGMAYAKDRFTLPGHTPDRQDFVNLPVLETDDTSHPYRQQLRSIMEKYGFNNSLISSPRYSAMLAKVLGGHGIFLVSEWTYICGMEKLGLLPLGRELDFGAAFVPDSLSPEKEALVQRIIRRISETMERESPRQTVFAAAWP